LPVRVRTADQPGGGAHVEEPRQVGIGLDGQLRAQRGDAGDDAQPLQKFALVLGVLGHDAGDVSEHLLHEGPCLDRLRCPGAVIVRHSETTIRMDVVSKEDSRDSLSVRKCKATRDRIAACRGARRTPVACKLG
jgi:hypothetical protein